MAMSLLYGGAVSLGTGIPLVDEMLAVLGLQISAGISAALDVMAKIGITPPSIQADLELAAQIEANLKLALEVGLTPPSIDVQLDIAAQLQIQLNILLKLINSMAAAGIWAYGGVGSISDIKSDINTLLASGLPGGSGLAEIGTAILLVAGASAGPAGGEAMQTVFGL